MRVGIWHGRDWRQIALTYDDGPNDPHTMELLDVLDDFNAKATFFVLGKFIDAGSDIIRATVWKGHTVGCHSYTHRIMSKLSNEDFLREIAKWTVAMECHGLKYDKYYRAPYCHLSLKQKHLVEDAGWKLVQYSFDSDDWKPKWYNRPVAESAAKVAEGVIAHLSKRKHGSIITMHDGYNAVYAADRSVSVQATKIILEHFKKHEPKTKFVNMRRLK